MDQATKDRLAVNIANLPKRASAIVTAIVSALVGFWEYLPDKCDLTVDPACTVSHQTVMAHIPVSQPTLAVLTILVPFLVAAVWPQFSLKPHVDAVLPEPAARPSVNFPLETGPVPLSAVTLPPSEIPSAGYQPRAGAGTAAPPPRNP